MIDTGSPKSVSIYRNYFAPKYEQAHVNFILIADAIKESQISMYM